MTTQMHVSNSTNDNSFEAGFEVGAEVLVKATVPPKLCVVLTSATYDIAEVLVGLKKALGDVPVIGCSMVSQFTRGGLKSRSVSIALIASDEMVVRLTSAERWVEQWVRRWVHQ